MPFNAFLTWESSRSFATPPLNIGCFLSLEPFERLAIKCIKFLLYSNKPCFTHVFLRIEKKKISILRDYAPQTEHWYGVFCGKDFNCGRSFIHPLPGAAPVFTYFSAHSPGNQNSEREGNPLPLLLKFSLKRLSQVINKQAINNNKQYTKQKHMKISAGPRPWEKRGGGGHPDP